MKKNERYKCYKRKSGKIRSALAPSVNASLLLQGCEKAYSGFRAAFSRIQTLYLRIWLSRRSDSRAIATPSTDKIIQYCGCVGPMLTTNGSMIPLFVAGIL
ncbi:hypothetical protein CM49_02396 [Paenibacillus sp. P1XP2]|nr:hypothetical protein CM49_02396 [Paenibacillus sp. P1XP2]